MYASKQNAHKIITKINKTSLIGLVESLDMASVVSPKELTASTIISYIRAKSNTRGSNVQTLYKLVNNQVEALEFLVKENSKAEMQAIGAGALNQAVKAVAIARGFVAPSGVDLVCVPAFAEVDVEGENRTGMKLIIESRK